MSEFDRACVDRMEEFGKTEFAYRDEHATKPATIGIVVGSSPVAMLAWYVYESPSLFLREVSDELGKV